MIIGLMGAAGSGKDTAASALRARGFVRVAFADALYEEVASAYRVGTGGEVSTKWLRNRKRKELPQPQLALRNCADQEFVRCLQQRAGGNAFDLDAPRSPRFILQQWGTEYRREWCGHSNYWIDLVRPKLVSTPNVVVTDVRFVNEISCVRDAGGKLLRIVRAQRKNQAAVIAHASEAIWAQIEPDLVVRNEETKRIFKLKVKQLPLR